MHPDYRIAKPAFQWGCRPERRFPEEIPKVGKVDREHVQNLPILRKAHHLPPALAKEAFGKSFTKETLPGKVSSKLVILLAGSL
ncbi:protein of unknown function [Thermococcus nautili]|uniref:hypothetical protein n=1 Tax=Thermococcus nautili TaxID=195522 RepID=UPI002557A2EE|nr:hypothetical protein [Thermococcus nautili]CAI1493099.1 protein of unknown function [Thermococcus nautili]